MDAASYLIRVWGEARDGSTAEVVIAGAGDPGNRITVKCACESALALTLDRCSLPDRSGVLTPSVAIGDLLKHRLAAAEMSISVRAT